jgi:hypothetical protein
MKNHNDEDAKAFAMPTLMVVHVTGHVRDRPKFVKIKTKMKVLRQLRYNFNRIGPHRKLQMCFVRPVQKHELCCEMSYSLKRLNCYYCNLQLAVW